MNWINVDASWPEQDQEVICFNGVKSVAAIHRYEHEKHYFYVQKYPGEMDRSIMSYWANVTHWQPMPANPKPVGQTDNDKFSDVRIRRKVVVLRRYLTSITAPETRKGVMPE